MKKFFFLGGLPRSGSTLLCNILAQNPEFYVSKATSGCTDIIFNIRNQWDKLIEHQAEGVDYDQLKRVLNGVINNYHSTDKNFIIDKGRGWISILETLEFMFGYTPKIIVPVRNINQILASFEKLWRKSTGFTQWVFEQKDYHESQTLEGRCSIWCRNDQPVGLAYNRIKDVITRGYKNKLLFLEYDFLTRNPKQALEQIYNYLELVPFEHNFDNIQHYTKENDIAVHRIPNLHTIKSKVETQADDSFDILGEALYHKYKNLEIWRN